MSTSTKVFVGVLIVIVMGLTSLWGVYAPTFSEAYVLPVQMTDASGATLGNFQCRPVAAENGKTLLVFRNKDFLRQTTGGMVHSRIILSYNSAAEALPVMALLPEGRRFLYTKGEIVCFYRLKR